MSTEMKVSVVSIGEEKTYGTNGFRKRSLIGRTEGEYATDYEFEFPNDKGDLLNGLNVGETITVSFNIRSRAWEDDKKEMKYFTSLSGWKVQREPLPEFN